MISEQMTTIINRLMDASADETLTEPEFQADMRELRTLVQKVRVLEARPPSDNVVAFAEHPHRRHSPWDGGRA